MDYSVPLDETRKAEEEQRKAEMEAQVALQIAEEKIRAQRAMMIPTSAKRFTVAQWKHEKKKRKIADKSRARNRR